MERRQDAVGGAGALRWRRQKADHLSAGGSALPVRERHRRCSNYCSRTRAHHAVIPNVNVLDDLESRLGRLSDDEKRLFALICRSYLAPVMPDYEYRQTVATIHVPVPGGATAEFRATGHIPLRLGWKAVYGALLEGKDRDNEPEQTLPRLTNGEAATLTKPKVEAKRTQPPPRYSEGTLVEARENSGRFVK